MLYPWIVGKGGRGWVSFVWVRLRGIHVVDCSSLHTLYLSRKGSQKRVFLADSMKGITVVLSSTGVTSKGRRSGVLVKLE